VRLLSVMGEYYAYRSLTFFDRMGAILTLIAAMFTVTWIQRHNELTALQAAGIPKSRVMVSVIAAVAAISLLGMVNRELVIPSAREQLSHNAQDLGGRSAKELQPRLDYHTEILFRGVETFADRKRIHKPTFLLPRGLSRYGKQLIAENAFYQPASGDQPGGYLLDKLSQPKDLDRQPSLSLAGQQVIITPQDAPWLQPGQCFVVSDVSFDHLTGGWKDLASIFELIRGLRNPSLDFGADVRVTIHARVVQPLLDVTLLFLGLPLVLSGNRNMFFAIGLCVGVVLGFMLVVIGCQYLGASGLLNPALAAWLPLMIFVPCAAAMYEPVQGSRGGAAKRTKTAGTHKPRGAAKRARAARV